MFFILIDLFIYEMLVTDSYFEIVNDWEQFFNINFYFLEFIGLLFVLIHYLSDYFRLLFRQYLI
jgi:hypothetical protein